MSKNLSQWPVVERLAAHHKDNPSPKWFHGKLVSAAEAARLQAQAPRAESISGLTAHQIAERLTAARHLQNPVVAPKAPTTGGVSGYTAFDDAGNCVGFVSYDVND